MAQESQGVSIFFSTSTALSTASTSIVGEVVGWNGPNGSANVIDVSHLKSTAKEKMIGLRDEGQLSIDVNFMATDAIQSKLRECRAARTKSHVGIGYVDGASSLDHFDCYVSGFSIQGAVDNKIAATITFEITGAVVSTTYAA